MAIGGVVKAYGLSPRGRGNLPLTAEEKPVDGSIPAWAGEPSFVDDTGDAQAVYPRVGGGTGIEGTGRGTGQGLSPRGRGNQHSSHSPLNWSGSIPAWAGEPSPSRPNPGPSEVYPRVGGGTNIPPTPP